MVHGGPIHAIPTATKYGRGIWAQIKRRGAVRSALLQGALLVALRHGASLNQAYEFVSAIKESMRRAGSRPKSLSGKALSVFRGGPATLFEGPEARHWKGRVRDLGVEALRAYQAEPPGEGAWSPELTETAFAEDYLEEVMAWLNQRKDEKSNPPELAILAEQARADNELEYERWWTPTRVRVSKVIVAAVIGAGIGHVANVQAPMTVPDWAETGTVAAAAAAIAARGSRSGASEEAEIEAAIAEVLTYSQRKLHAALRGVVDQLVQVIDPSLRAPPLGRGQQLTDTIKTALEVLDKRLEVRKEIELTLNGADRRGLATACEYLRREAEGLDLTTIDAACLEEIQTLAHAADVLSGDPPVRDEEKKALGTLFMVAVEAAWRIAARLEGRVLAEQATSPPGSRNVRVLLPA